MAEFDMDEHFKQVAEHGVEFVRCKCGAIIAGSVVYLNGDDEDWKESVEEYKKQGYEVFISKEPGKYPMQECTCPPLITIQVPEGSYIIPPGDVETVQIALQSYAEIIRREAFMATAQEQQTAQSVWVELDRIAQDMYQLKKSFT